MRARSREATWSQPHSRSTQARPASPIALACAGSSSSAEPVRQRLDVAAADHVAGLAVQDRVRRAAGVAGDDRQPGRRRLQVDDAQALDVEAAAAGAARHREHVAGRVVGRQLVPRHGAGEDDVRAPRPCAPRASVAGPARYGPPPTISSAALGHPRRIAGSARISVSWPLRGTSRDTHTTTGRSAEAVAARRTAAPPDGRGGRRRCRPRACSRAIARPRRRQRRREPDPGVLAQVGHDVGLARRSGAAGRGRPAARPSRPRARGSARRPARTPACRSAGREQPERRGRPEPGPRRSRARARSRRARRATPGVGSITEVGCRTTGNGCSASNAAAPGHARRRRPPSPRAAERQLVHERLDAAGPRREVVGDDQGTSHNACQCREARPRPRAGALRERRGGVSSLRRAPPATVPSPLLEPI